MSQKYKMMSIVYPRNELDKMEDQIENIEKGNEVMLALYRGIQWIQDRAKAQVLEADKYYNAASMEIFNNDSREELGSLEVVVQQFRASFERVKDGIDIQQIFKMEEVLKELDSQLDKFVGVRQEVRDFHKEVRNKYQALNLPKPQEVASLIEKFKAVHLGIILTQGQQNPYARDSIFFLFRIKTKIVNPCTL